MYLFVSEDIAIVDIKSIEIVPVSYFVLILSCAHDKFLMILRSHCYTGHFEGIFYTGNPHYLIYAWNINLFNTFTNELLHEKNFFLFLFDYHKKAHISNLMHFQDKMTNS